MVWHRINGRKALVEERFKMTFFENFC